MANIKAWPQRLEGTKFIILPLAFLLPSRLRGNIKEPNKNLHFSLFFFEMKDKRLNTKNKIYTTKSKTTTYIDYSEKRKILEVEFTTDNIYHYLKVEPLVWEEYKELILSGGSSGEFVNRKIKPKYAFRKIH